MPGFDATGPGGMGPMTGRRMGRCALPPQAESSPAGEAGEGTPVQQPQVYGRGRGGVPYGCGRGFGRGRGRRCRW